MTFATFWCSGRRNMETSDSKSKIIYYLRVWIGFVGLMAFGNTVQCFVDGSFIKSRLYTRDPSQGMSTSHCHTHTHCRNCDTDNHTEREGGGWGINIQPCPSNLKL